MKFYKNQLHILLDKIKNKKITSLLIYGPDQSYIANVISNISDIMAVTPTSIDYKEINDNNFQQIINRNNFFSQSEIIIVTNSTSNISDGISKLLEKSFDNFLIFVGKEMRATSKIRKLFELSKQNLACLPAYINEKVENITLARNEFRKHGKNIAYNELQFFCHLAPSTISDIKSEVQKLVDFTQNRSITEQDIKELTYHDGKTNFDNLCYAFITGSGKIFYQELEYLESSATSNILIIRAIIRYVINIIKVKKSSNSLDVAIKSLKPAIFFKSLRSFRLISINSDLAYLNLIIAKLFEVEINIKKGKKFGQVLDQAFLSLQKNNCALEKNII